MNQARSYAQLVRLPNVFTALADIGLAALAVGVQPEQAGALALLLLSSACLYCGGMVWNDFFDVEQDQRERPHRPIPSGRIRRPTAALVGAVLLTAGLGLAALAAWRSGAVAAALVVMILFYDGWLKRTWLGPLAMGSCRFLNVNLGLSIHDDYLGAAGLHLALVVGLYIVGVTWFARTEARASSVGALKAAAIVMLLAFLMAVPVPLWFDATTGSQAFLYLLVALGFMIGIPLCRAIGDPVPATVQAAVKRSILGLVGLDAVLATAAAGWIGLGLLALLPPALYLGRRLYST